MTIEEQKNEDLKLKPQTEPETPEAQAIKPSPAQDNPVFFNVMPKPNENSTIVQPTMKAEAPVNEPPKSKFKPVLLKYKWYFIIGLIIIIAGPIAYFFLLKATTDSYKINDIVVKHPIVTKTPSGESPSNQSPGFTTSQDWRNKYFSNCTEAALCGDNADPDHDGLNNLKEFQLGTDPNNPDSDQDGLSDGDEIAVFTTNPLSPHTSKDLKYSDADFFIAGYDVTSDKKMTASQITSLSEKIKQLGLHEPTVKTLNAVLISIYNFSGENSTNSSSTPPASPATTSPLSNFDQSLGAKQDRDTQRSSTIKNIESGLVKYQADNSTYPIAADFPTMFNVVKPYLKVATNPTDPVNKDPYLYSYVSDNKGADFTLSFYSEVAGQIIKKHSSDAIKDSNTEQAGIYDDQRKNDLLSLQTALLLYSQKNIAGNQDYVFPATDKYKIVLLPEFISQIPKDPKTGNDYEYSVSTTFDTFTLKAMLDNPAVGTTGWLCNQEECRAY